MKKGRLIVIEGVDGSGKTTQTDLLKKKLKSDGYKVKSIHFPNKRNFFGGLIEKYLANKNYNFLKVHSEIISELYAADRWESSKLIYEWLNKGYIVVLDRYVSANQIHQGGKIKNIHERKEYIKFLDKMEYKVFKIPRPDVVFCLNSPLSIVLGLLNNRSSSKNKTRSRRKKDVHENSKEFMANSYKTALWLAKTQPKFVKIDCAPRGILRTREDIRSEIYGKVKKLLK